jgi:hypothetical protein
MAGRRGRVHELNHSGHRPARRRATGVANQQDGLAMADQLTLATAVDAAVGSL